MKNLRIILEVLAIAIAALFLLAECDSLVVFIVSKAIALAVVIGCALDLEKIDTNR